VEVGTAAVARAIERAGWRREDVDFLATTTCTGRVCPSLDAQIINELGLKPCIQRVHVGDTGCASAMVAMQQVSNHLRAFPGHRAVMVAVEICSAAYFLDDRLESAVAHAIFADGAGAIALSADGAGPEIVEHRTMFRSEHLGAMGFEYPGGRPRVVLSKDVRRIGAGMMKEMADALMASHGLKKDDIAHFVLHSAGRRVIEQVGKLMELDENRLAHSRNVLQQYGNMSSATVVFVLDDLLRSGSAGAGRLGPRDRARWASRPRRAAPAGSMPFFLRWPGPRRARDHRRAARPLRRWRCMTDISRVNALFGGRMVTMIHVKRLLTRCPPTGSSPCSTWDGAGTSARACAGRGARAGASASSRWTAIRPRCGSRRSWCGTTPRSPSCAAMRSPCRSARRRWISPSPR
jgi:alkylresorcinol/alkylpyrone synthase